MQSYTQSGLVIEGASGPDFVTNALVLEALQAIGRLDVIDMEREERYYAYSFVLGSADSAIVLQRIFTEGSRPRQVLSSVRN